MSTLAAVILAVIGFSFLVALCVAGVAALYDEWHRPDESADPYRAGLDASARMASVAFEAEHLLHVAAENAKHEETEDR